MSKTFKSEGIVLRTLKYSETSLILDIYTKEKGLGSFIVGGVRKAKSKMQNVFHPMNIIDLVAYNSNQSLSRIKEGHYAYTYEKLNRDVVTSSVGTFMIDLIRSSISERELDEELYDFVRSTLVDLDKGHLSLQDLPIRFAIQLAVYLGFQIQDNYSEAQPYFDLQSGQYISELRTEKEVLDEHISYQLHLLMQDGPPHKLTREDKQTLLDKMLDYYRFHIENFKELRSLPVLRAILS